MAVYSKSLLSGSVNGKSIMVSVFAQPGVTVHTAVAGTASLDEVFLYAYNSYGSTVNLNLFWGGTTINDTEVYGVPPGVGRVMVVDGRLINNGLVITATSPQSGTNAIYLDGFVNNIS